MEAGVAYTFSAGPWHGDAFHGTLVDGVRQWHASSTSADPIFRLMYPQIVHDYHGGDLPGDFGSEEHIEATWQWLPMCLGLLKQGMQMKFSRWYQFVDKTLLFAPYWSMILAVTIYVGIFQGWLSSASDLPFVHQQQARVSGTESALNRV